MNAKYQKYYSALKGKDFSASVSKYSNALSSAKNQISSVKTIIGSNSWVEKGINSVNASLLPSINSDLDKLQSSISSLASSVATISSLVDVLSRLETACNAYNSCKEEEKPHYGQIISSLEGQADGLISSLSGSGSESSITSASASLSTGSSASMSEKKKSFLGTLNDDTYWTDPNYTKKARELLLFDNTTGEILKEGDSIDMKVGEKRVLTVKLPTDAGKINEIIRTSAWKPDGNKVVNTYSDVNPDPDVVEYVNFHNNHYPKDKSVLHSNYYDWVIEATSEGGVQISQTCLYSREEGGPCPKAMVDIHVNVT